MTLLHVDLNDCISRLRRCQSGADYAGAIEGISRSLGFDYFLYTVYPSSDAIDSAPDCDVTVSNFPVDWASEYRARHYVQCDPVVQAVRRSESFCLWDCATIETNHGGLGHGLWARAHAAGLHHGVTFPLTSLGGEFAFVSWAAAPVRAQDTGATSASVETDAVTGLMPVLNLVSELFHSRARNVLTHEAMLERSGLDEVRLSPREREVLTWVAQGKSAWEIGTILTLSQKTVELYATNAMKKLQAVNRTQAVVRAVQCGLIGGV